MTTMMPSNNEKWKQSKHFHQYICPLSLIHLNYCLLQGFPVININFQCQAWLMQGSLLYYNTLMSNPELNFTIFSPKTLTGPYRAFLVGVPCPLIMFLPFVQNFSWLFPVASPILLPLTVPVLHVHQVKRSTGAYWQ